MTTVQVNLDEELNKKVDILKVEKDLDNKGEAVLFILSEYFKNTERGE